MVNAIQVKKEFLQKPEHFTLVGRAISAEVNAVLEQLLTEEKEQLSPKEKQELLRECLRKRTGL